MTRAQWAVTLLTLACGAARAENVVAVIDRPLTLPRNAFDATLDLPYTNWSGNVLGPGANTSSAEALAAGVDYGLTDRVQLGLSAAFAINPGAAFGSILLSSVVALDQKSALRFDVGYERIGINGGPQTFSGSHISRYFAGFGVPAKVALTPTLAFVTGRTGAVHFGNFINLDGGAGTGAYFGASRFTETDADILTVSDGDNQSGTVVGINLPFGLMAQPDPHFALTLRTGYSAVVAIPGGSGNSIVDHFIPLGIEGVFSPLPMLDVGASFTFDGYLTRSGSGSTTGLPGYFDMRSAQFWIRFRGGA